jgi:Fe-S-cluster containining protein
LDKNDKCKIHESKPQECRESFACKNEKNKPIAREKIVEYWKKHQSFILKLKRDTWRDGSGRISDGYMD